MVPFLDLKTQYQSIKQEIDTAVLDVLGSTQYALGPRVADFETKFAAHSGTKHAIAVNSGTSALHVALLAADIGPGDEVITVAHTFVATSAAIIYAGAAPVFVDVDPVTWTMDPALIEAAITPKTKAIMPVHLHGLTADMDAIQAVADKHGLLVIEDAAQAHGAEYKGRRAGSLGDIGCFSFYPGKNLGAYGEGGAVVCDDDGYDKTMRMLRDWGQAEKFAHVLKGFNYRMDGVQGAVLGVKMDHIENWTEARRKIAARYDALLSETDIVRPSPPADCRHVYHVYSICVSDRDRVRTELNDMGIQSGIHYPVPVHLQKAYEEFGHGKGSLPVTEKLADAFLSLPMYPEMPSESADEVIEGLLRVV